MRLVTFGIDENRNLIIQFPVFVQPYMQKQLILYQIKRFLSQLYTKMGKPSPIHS